MSEVRHTVTVQADHSYEFSKPSVTFTCTGTRESDCHRYPDSDEWSDGDDQERIPHDECWMQGWLDNDMYDYVGSDRLSDWDGLDGVPNVSRTGEVEVNYEWDGYVTWKFKENTQ